MRKMAQLRQEWIHKRMEIPIDEIPLDEAIYLDMMAAWDAADRIWREDVRDLLTYARLKDEFDVACFKRELESLLTKHPELKEAK